MCLSINSTLGANERPIPPAELRPIYGIWGIISLIAGNYLIVITKADVIGTLNGSEIYHIRESDIIPYQKAELHLTPKQVRFNPLNSYKTFFRTSTTTLSSTCCALCFQSTDSIIRRLLIYRVHFNSLVQIHRLNSSIVLSMIA